MSYDIFFVRRAPGQSWEAALGAMGKGTWETEVASAPRQWDQVASRVREILGDVPVLKDDPTWAIDDRGGTEIEVSCFSSREWWVKVPYWSSGETARAIAAQLRAVARIVQDATGLEAYDLQLEAGVTSDAWTPEKAAAVFDRVARSFEQRGIRHG